MEYRGQDGKEYSAYQYIAFRYSIVLASKDLWRNTGKMSIESSIRYYEVPSDAI